MFIGRQQELDTLNKLYHSGKFEFAVIYGRRRVGKTALISEFSKEKDTVFFTGVETNAKQNLDNFSRCIMEYDTGIAAGLSFASFQAALEYVFELAKTKRLVLVLDEYPYIARASKSLASTLQLLIDKNKDSSKLFLIHAKAVIGAAHHQNQIRILRYLPVSVHKSIFPVSSDGRTADP